jgi:hypothetical protein
MIMRNTCDGDVLESNAFETVKKAELSCHGKPHLVGQKRVFI